MGFQCSILGHTFEDAGVERERTEQGSEVVTTEREIERCRRCGKERVVSESTEVAAVVDASEVDIDADGDEVEATSAAEDAGDAADPATDVTSETGGGLSGAIERSTADEADDDELDDGTGEPTDTDTTADTVDSGIDLEDAETADPAEEDAEILTDDDSGESDRQPGQWPEEQTDDGGDDERSLTETSDEPSVSEPTDRSLSGITVPEGQIVCPDCSFSIEANSGYRAGDPCPNCNAWLEAERNQ